MLCGGGAQGRGEEGRSRGDEGCLRHSTGGWGWECVRALPSFLSPTPRTYSCSLHRPATRPRPRAAACCCGLHAPVMNTARPRSDSISDSCGVPPMLLPPPLRSASAPTVPEPTPDRGRGWWENARGAENGTSDPDPKSAMVRDGGQPPSNWLVHGKAGSRAQLQARSRRPLT